MYYLNLSEKIRSVITKLSIKEGGGARNWYKPVTGRAHSYLELYRLNTEYEARIDNIG